MSRFNGLTQLFPLLAGTIPGRTEQSSRVGPDEIVRKMRLDYLYSQKDLNQKALDGVMTLFAHLQRSDFSLDEFMNEALNLIRRRLWIREVTVALKDRRDGKFRYRYQAGLRREAWDAHLLLEYGAEDYLDPTVYKAREISKLTTLFLAEDNPYGKNEDGTFSRPAMLESKRVALEDSIEGDYFDVWIMGRDREVLGWVEFNGTTAGKFPDTMTIKWVEVISTVMGTALMLSESKGFRAAAPQ
ncbi:MAG: hypothetical protein AB1793_04220 [Candidatus Thermoplasmatota archaeon]